mmetsp:Transcript_97129/g.172971  ORF Transcript_97129/g.172971 Transcript_97129/m.172971 type:complete len:215 (-) Transcript_97129:38-682(-)
MLNIHVASRPNLTLAIAMSSAGWTLDRGQVLPCLSYVLVQRSITFQKLTCCSGACKNTLRKCSATIGQLGWKLRCRNSRSDAWWSFASSDLTCAMSLMIARSLWQSSSMLCWSPSRGRIWPHEVQQRWVMPKLSKRTWSWTRAQAVASSIFDALTWSTAQSVFLLLACHLDGVITHKMQSTAHSRFFQGIRGATCIRRQPEGLGTVPSTGHFNK